jgi:hypothetical protein
MSVEAIKVNELLREASDFCKRKATEIKDLVNEEVRTPEFLMSADGAADDLNNRADEILDLTLDEEEG